MPLFICSKCECVENTATGHWWNRSDDSDLFIWPDGMEQFRGKGLCSECAPSRYNDGTLTKFGKWHGKFEKEHYTQVSYQNELINRNQFRFIHKA